MILRIENSNKLTYAIERLNGCKKHYSKTETPEIKIIFTKNIS